MGIIGEGLAGPLCKALWATDGDQNGLLGGAESLCFTSYGI